MILNTQYNRIMSLNAITQMFDFQHKLVVVVDIQFDCRLNFQETKQSLNQMPYLKGKITIVADILE